MLVSRLVGVAVVSVLALAAVGGAQAATKKEPPACAAISFRPLVPGMPDGEQDSGLYKSRFGKIELKAKVEGGEARDYFMTINGQRPEVLKAGIPKSAESCLRSKNVKTPAKASEGACTGNRFRVVIDRSGAKKVVMLFGLQGDEWRFCQASEV
ncbi:MAG TPA: hypothetical protein VEB64_16740 [Azospirillaceae bacterium]|nr:hypothetical protein [Azospirillaceae bacterium]